MTPIRSREGVALVEDAARDRALLAFDFDGTLAPHVEGRRAATMRDSTRALLRMAGILYPCAVFSGGDRADVLPRVARVPLVAVFGNHGAEPEEGAPDPRISRQVQAWAAALRAVLDGAEGVDVEQKAVGISVHYRRTLGRADVQRRLLEVASSLPGARVFGGEAVLNLAPCDLPTKGNALEALAARLGPRTVVFVGDDADEDAFRSCAVTAGIRLGPSTASAARFYLRAQSDVDELLRALVAARSRAACLGERWPQRCGAPKNGGDG
ncbi:trehalose-phosphatase [Anaeromyxobacter oryzae]|uniref:Trehalose 6-phosphate phosphatase n=1 Tax=Anaeromyxobacter oryzae TaxID=2918170 RepID=A0ABN6MRP9_9BACT|nr:trehalose-phosphatase [Anaeromyxobacter oryzae]BDG02310.1 trehalose 6-phosphate phosphatase [Anaeromyxobacter oryzae]